MHDVPMDHLRCGINFDHMGFYIFHSLWSTDAITKMTLMRSSSLAQSCNLQAMFLSFDSTLSQLQLLSIVLYTSTMKMC